METMETVAGVQRHLASLGTHGVKGRLSVSALCLTINLIQRNILRIFV